MPRRTRTTFITEGKHIAQFRARPLEIIVELDGDKISFRHKGQRQRFQMDISEAFKEAILRTSARKFQ